MTAYLPGAMATINRNKAGAPFRYAESLFADITSSCLCGSSPMINA